MLPSNWMPAADMRRVVVHWTAGAHKANAVDKRHYHVLIEGDGNLVRGNHPISANVPPLASGGYAAHTASLNSHSIGVAMCCMAGAVESPFNAGSHPMTQVQWDAMTKAVAALCKQYSIPVGPKTVLTHAEVQPTLGVKQAGKWDITRLAFDPSVSGYVAVGLRLRRDVAAAMRAQEAPSAPVSPPPAPKAPDWPEDPSEPAEERDNVPIVMGVLGVLFAIAAAALVYTILT